MKSPVPRSGHRQCRARSYRWGRGNRVFVDEGLGGGFRAFFRRSGLPVGAPSLPLRETFAAAQEDLDEYAARQGLSLLSEARACRVCGCRDDRVRDSCLDPETEEPCSWTEQDLCSACAARTARAGRMKNEKRKMKSAK